MCTNSDIILVGIIQHLSIDIKFQLYVKMFKAYVIEKAEIWALRIRFRKLSFFVKIYGEKKTSTDLFDF